MDSRLPLITVTIKLAIPIQDEVEVSVGIVALYICDYESDYPPRKILGECIGRQRNGRLI